MFNFSVFLSALGISFSQIVGIGPQNAYVLRQGIGRSHVVPIILICIVADILLIASGVLGMGKVVAGIPGFVGVVAWGGAAFILWLGFKSFRSAFSAGAMSLEGSVERDRKRAIRTILAVTLLNPYVWLDTVVLIGGVSSVYGEHGALSFLLGSLCASVLWFGAIGLFAGKLAPLFQKPSSWKVLDCVIGLVMLFTAAMLIGNYGLSAPLPL
ncbi:LysE/ArgO family amino acid transporter [Chromobacterium subtsugae]|uniref:LysE/ArgO family amino acid transporter n=1 Tax=Chromobacterium subtsugae TaxID=251747 RepID=A0ABS7FF61_9NEIS|nr:MULTISPECIES: LysE/ArgO family amino acid transporter [Chromobacterium]KUM01912.1 lysine transporter LysE [Chromobacterium subtsugae]KZE88302.1 lysine transporter LysE [Chromobacterium sp. F49]MBW7565622.1 amino acid transporter [Chromobacterium subtsugae]MBW8287953.1 LysE/ArgO family amino acid transporter [Chromobacterium subtsugae]OBU87013.1 amino acid transporter LysE [Chromobacterium subtsugae]